MSPVVLVTGAAGHLGRQVLALLAGHLEVRALGRRGGAAHSGIRWIRGDLLDPDVARRSLEGVDTVLHLATQPLRVGADFAITRTLLEVAHGAGVRHVVYPGIVGVEAMQGAAYYREKLEVEALVQGSGLPYTLLRATQFHELIAELLGRLTWGPLSLLPAGACVQPVEAAAVAARLSALVLNPPAGRVRDLSGPEALGFADLARAWQRHQGRRAVQVSLPLPLPIFRAWRGGAALPHDAEVVGQRWAEWLGAGATRPV